LWAPTPSHLPPHPNGYSPLTIERTSPSICTPGARRRATRQSCKKSSHTVSSCFPPPPPTTQQLTRKHDAEVNAASLPLVFNTPHGCRPTPLNTNDNALFAIKGLTVARLRAGHASSSPPSQSEEHINTATDWAFVIDATSTGQPMRARRTTLTTPPLVGFFVENHDQLHRKAGDGSSQVLNGSKILPGRPVLSPSPGMLPKVAVVKDLLNWEKRCVYPPLLPVVMLIGRSSLMQWAMRCVESSITRRFLLNPRVLDNHRPANASQKDHNNGTSPRQLLCGESRSTALNSRNIARAACVIAIPRFTLLKTYFESLDEKSPSLFWRQRELIHILVNYDEPLGDVGRLPYNIAYTMLDFINVFRNPIHCSQV
ncbi:hypothetical protein BD779DRAFT_1478651, partial [Infundibulicybe gibba]